MQPIPNLDFGFIVMSPKCNERELSLTVRTIGYFYPNSTVLAVVPKTSTGQQIMGLERHCAVEKSGNTYTSLINKGVKCSKQDWNFILLEGTMVRSGLYKKYARFIQNENDILFPIIDRKWDFIDGSLNGLFIHKNVLKKVGKMPERSDITQSKLIWAYEAIQAGCRFKGLLGVRIS